MAETQIIPGELLSRLARYGRVHLLDTVTSTNDYALTLLEPREPAIVVARQQTKGRGRFRRHWFADEDSLVFSLLLFPDASALPVSAVTQLAGLALSNAIDSLTGLKTTIRWPNDVLHRDRKVAGILCEGKRGAVVIGVGVNVNQTAFPETLPEAASLRQASGHAIDALRLLEAFLAEMFRLTDEATRGGIVQLLPDIKARSAIMHRRVEVRTMFLRHVGTVIDLDAEGRIVLRTDSGRLEVLNAGQVRQLR
jgi:BirA family biotin operon repressor/biotin-[acetyl-CoA-carboxylase] ligase